MLTREEIENLALTARKYGGTGLDEPLKTMLVNDAKQRQVIEAYENCHKEIAARLGYKHNEVLTRHSFILQQIEQQAQEIERLKEGLNKAANRSGLEYQQIQTLREALSDLLEENIDYIKINNLSAMGNVNIVKAQRVLDETA